MGRYVINILLTAGRHYAGIHENNINCSHIYRYKIGSSKKRKRRKIKMLKEKMIINGTEKRYTEKRADL